MVALANVVHIFLKKSPCKIWIIKKVECQNKLLFPCIFQKKVYKDEIPTGCNIIQQSGKLISRSILI